MVTSDPGASLSRVLSIGITMTALTGPVLAAYDRSVVGNYDTDPTFFVLPYVVIGFMMFAMYAPALIVASLHAPTSRSVWAGTAWLLGCLGAAYVTRALTHHPAAVLAFPVGGLAAMVGAVRINERARPARAPSGARGRHRQDPTR